MARIGGLTSERPRPMIGVTDEELAAVTELWSAADRPKAWVGWMGDRLAEMGFPRRASHSVRRLVRVAKLKNPIATQLP